MSEQNGRVLIIAGSDSGGGAGIQADIKAVSALGAYAMTAITAITAQNTMGVFDVWPVPIDSVLAQIDVTLADIGADVVKTGMLGSAELIEAVAERLTDKPGGIPVVCDPVMVATSGDRLVEDKAVGAICSLMVPGARLVTPNSHEAEILTGKAVDTIDGQRRAAEALLELGANGALVKGGHVGGDRITDVLQTTTGEWMYEGERLETTSTHGTGCTLASAIAAELSLGASLPRAVERARAYVHGAIENAPGLGGGHGPLDHGWMMREEH